MDAKKVLFLAANPLRHSSLALKAEAQEITSALAAGRTRGKLVLEARFAATPEVLRDGLLQLRPPTVVHFSGHGIGDPTRRSVEKVGHAARTLEDDGDGGILFEGDGRAEGYSTASARALAELFGLLRGSVELVVLNACHSHPQAQAIADAVGFAIGTHRSIGDVDARRFSVGLYQGLAEGLSIRDAFVLGRNSVNLHDPNARGDSFALICGQGADPERHKIAKRSIWMTYAQADDADGDVTFYADSLQAAGVEVTSDRWVVRRGRPRWDAVDAGIRGCDAWVIVVTQRSLRDAACKEQLAWAFERALDVRDGLPLIGLFPGKTDPELIPSAIRCRSVVSLDEPDWASRIVEAAEGRTERKQQAESRPYLCRSHRLVGSDAYVAIEIRPRAGAWDVLKVLVPADDPCDVVGVQLGPTGGPPVAPSPLEHRMRRDELGLHLTIWGTIDPVTSAYVICRVPPARVYFGRNRENQYEQRF